MKQHLKALSKQTVIYGGGLLLKRGIGFFMIPLYTRFLTPEDYGTLEILELTGFIVAFFVGFGILQAVYRFHADADGPVAKRHVLTNAVLAVAVVGGLVTLACVAGASFIARAVLGNTGASSLVALLFAGVFFSEICQLVLGYFRVESRPVAYIAYSLLSTLVSLSLNIVFLVGLGMGVYGMLLSTLIASALFAGLLVFGRVPGGGWRPDPALMRAMLGYCIPFIPMGLMQFTVNFSDRYFLRVFTDMHTVGVYALGYKLGMVVGFLVGTPFSLVWNAQAFEIASDAQAPRTYARVLTYFGGALVAVCLAMSILAPELVRIMAAPEYAPAARIIPIIAWSTVCLNLTTMLQIGILLKKRTFWLPVVWGGTTLINVVLNVALIPKMGMMGAAWATIAALAYQAGMTMYISNRLYPIPYEWRRISILLGAALAAQSAAGLLPAGLPLVPSVVMKTAVLVSFLAALLLSPWFLFTEEKALLRDLPRRLSFKRGAVS